MKEGDKVDTPLGEGTVKAIQGRVAVVEVPTVQTVYVGIPPEEPPK